MIQFNAVQILLLVIGATYASYLPVPLEYSPTVVGHTLHTIPTAVSHQSQTIVHDSRPYLRPIVSHEPLIKTHVVPVSTYGYAPFAYNKFGYSGHSDWSPSYSAVKHNDWSPHYGPVYSAWRK